MATEPLDADPDVAYAELLERARAAPQVVGVVVFGRTASARATSSGHGRDALP